MAVFRWNFDGSLAQLRHNISNDPLMAFRRLPDGSAHFDRFSMIFFRSRRFLFLRRLPDILSLFLTKLAIAAFSIQNSPLPQGKE
ncbi:hypothetical protein TorRG33x02_345020, partial [Trema orientale]